MTDVQDTVVLSIISTSSQEGDVVTAVNVIEVIAPYGYAFLPSHFLYSVVRVHFRSECTSMAGRNSLVTARRDFVTLPPVSNALHLTTRIILGPLVCT